MTYWTTQKFKDLQEAWYQRLKDEGFEDAETVVKGELVLKAKLKTVQLYKWENDDPCHEIEDYFRFMSAKVQETVFASTVDHVILKGHAEGKKIRHIREDLKGLGIPRARNTIRFRIRVYEMKWGLRTYTPKQLNRKVS